MVIFQGVYPTGSSYTGLRISDAREFDFNVVLSIPHTEDFLSLEFDDSVPAGFARARFRREYLPEKLRPYDQQFCNNFLEASGEEVYLSRRKVMLYFDWLLRGVLNRLNWKVLCLNKVDLELS